jgi:hypothetical protein
MQSRASTSPLSSSLSGEVLVYATASPPADTSKSFIYEDSNNFIFEDGNNFVFEDSSLVASIYNRPGGVDEYFRPGGVDQYNRP